MTTLLNNAVLIAAEVGDAGGAGGNGAEGAEGGLLGALGPLIPIIIIFILFIWFTSRSQKKRQQERQEMLDSIKPKDDVVTIGGIKGRVVSISDDEVVLRVDPEKDIKITMSRSGIGGKQGEEQEQ